jgi:hypothetical protein
MLETRKVICRAAPRLCNYAIRHPCVRIIPLRCACRSQRAINRTHASTQARMHAHARRRARARAHTRQTHQLDTNTCQCVTPSQRPLRTPLHGHSSPPTAAPSACTPRACTAAVRCQSRPRRMARAGKAMRTGRRVPAAVRPQSLIGAVTNQRCDHVGVARGRCVVQRCVPASPPAGGTLVPCHKI